LLSKLELKWKQDKQVEGKGGFLTMGEEMDLNVSVEIVAV